MRTEAGSIVVVHPGVGRSVHLLTLGPGSNPTHSENHPLTLAEASEISMALAVAVARQDGSHPCVVRELEERQRAGAVMVG